MNHERTQTRTEHSRNLEDAEKYKAIETLTELGLFVPLRYVEAWHGRAGDGTDWAIDPRMRNGYGQNDNDNVNQRSTIYAGMKDVAKQFADIRARQKGRDDFQAEMHRIVSEDTDAVVIDATFSEQDLDDKERYQYHDALRALSPGLSKGAPPSFAAGQQGVVEAYYADRRTQGGSQVDINQMAVRTGQDELELGRLAGAERARHVIATMSPVGAAKAMLRYRAASDIEPGIDAGYVEYIESWFKNAHVVGLSQKVTSATLGRSITMATFFDLMNVQAEGAIAKRRERRARSLGGAGLLMRDSTKESYNRHAHPVMKALANAYVSPHALIDEADKTRGFQGRFDRPSGVWEGFTLGQHTETVLRNFDETYADSVPVNLLLPMRLAMLVHDIGKPVAHAEGNKSQQVVYNKRDARRFMTEVGVDDPLQTVVLGVMGKGCDLALQMDVRKHPQAGPDLMAFAKETLARAYGPDRVDDDSVRGFVTMCRMFRICDGGAYTDMAVTRKPNGAYYRNAPSFNAGFHPPAGLGGRSIAPRL
ncbi:MAG TPA: hypothetical protein PKD28_04305 [Candidatus Saccharibacteria bacterium]|nr:hypothetical protein [Candidatus Saccharibacteria bacterium]